MLRNENVAPASITALSVCHSLLMCSQHPDLRHLVSPDLAMLNEFVFNKLLKMYPLWKDTFALNKGRATFGCLTMFPAQWQKSFMDHFGAIGLPQHVAMRKLLMEQQVIKSIKAGTTNILIFGAGYDVLVDRLRKTCPHVTFIELDRGNTRLSKLEILKSYYGGDYLKSEGDVCYVDNAYYVNCDLSLPDWHQKLIRLTVNNKPVFDPSKKSIAILEGLTMYLTMEQNTALLQTLRDNVLSQDSKIILSFNQTNRYYKENKAGLAMVTEAGESFEGELKAELVPGYIHQLNLSLDGKVLSNYFQEISGNAQALVHANIKRIIVEDYYLISTTARENACHDINLIPNIAIDVPSAPENNKAFACSIV